MSRPAIITRLDNVITRLRNELNRRGIQHDGTLESMVQAVKDNMKFSIDAALNDGSVIEGGIGSIDCGNGKTFADLFNESIIGDNVKFLNDFKNGNVVLGSRAYEGSNIIMLPGGVYTSNNNKCDYCFNACSLLTQVGSADSYFDISSISNNTYTFYMCSNLKKAYIKTEHLDNAFFRECKSLEEVHFQGMTNKTGHSSDQVFIGCTNLKRIYNIGSICASLNQSSKVTHISFIDGAVLLANTNTGGNTVYTFSEMNDYNEIKNIALHLEDVNGVTLSNLRKGIKFSKLGELTESQQSEILGIISQKGWVHYV